MNRHAFYDGLSKDKRSQNGIGFESDVRKPNCLRFLAVMSSEPVAVLP